MAFEEVAFSGTANTGAMNFVTLRQVIDDFIITMDGDDYVSNASDVAMRNIALRGIREFGFDVTNRIRSIKRTIGSNNTVALPEDFVGLVKMGVVDSEGILRVFGENKNISASRAIGSTTTDAEKGPLNIPSNLTLNRSDSKSATAGNDGGGDNFDYYVFENCTAWEEEGLQESTE